MQQNKNAKDAQQQKKKLESLLQTASTENAKKIIKKIDQMYQVQGYVYLMFLYIHNILPRTLALIELKSINDSQLINMMMEIVQTIKFISVQFYKQAIKDHKQFYEKNILNKQKAQNLKLQERAKNNSSNTVKKWIKNYFQIKQSKQTKQTKMKTIQSFVRMVDQDLSLQKINQGIFEEILLNWFKYKLDILRHSERQNPQGPQDVCCKLYWSLQVKDIKIKEDLRRDFRKYTYPFNQNITVIIKKLLISFLNGQGGLIFIGLAGTKSTNNNIATLQLKINGIIIQKKDLGGIYNQFQKYVEQIFPKHQNFHSKKYQNIHNTKGQSIIIRDRIKLPLNDYISIQFSPLISEDNFMNIRGDNQSTLYILKVFVKKGHPKHFYYMISNQQNLDFYQRKNAIDGSIQTTKIPLHQAIARISNKVADFKKCIQQANEKCQTYKDQVKNKQINEYLNNCRHKFHSDCFLSMNTRIIDVKVENNQGNGLEKDSDSDSD